MKTIAKIALVALSLTATAAAAGQGDKITAMGYGHNQQHAKIVTIQTWTAAAHDSYGYADWNSAYIGNMECVQNTAYATSQYSTLSREVIKIGGDQNAPWSCIVSGYQEVKSGSYNGGGYQGGFKSSGYDGGYTGGFKSSGYTGGHKITGYKGGSAYKY